MLVFFMLVSAVVSSPVSLSTFRQDAFEKNEKLYPRSISSSSYRVELFHSIESPPPSSPVADASRESQLYDDKSSSVRNTEGSLLESSFATDDDVDESKPFISLHHNNDFKLKRADRLPRNSILPPLILAHHSSEISLEPTEVEAPGTTPTTLSMITESTVNIVQNHTNKPMISENLSKPNSNHNSNLNVDKNNDSDINSFLEQVKANEDSISNSNSEVKEKEKSFPQLNVKKDNILSNLDQDKDRTLQKDASNIELHNDSSKDAASKFKIKTINNTYTLVHEKEETLETKNTSEDVSLNNNSENRQLDKNNENFKRPTENGWSFEYKSEIGLETKDISKSNGNNKNLSSSEISDKNRESKRIVTAAELLLNISNHRQMFDSIPSENINQNPKIKSSEVLIEEEKVQDDKYIDSILIGTEHIGQVAEEDKLISELNANENNNNAKSSNIETREVDNDSYFILVNSELAPKVVKKDDSDVAKQPDESRYRMDVITSSSEVTYKQFDPLKNTSVYTKNFDSPKEGQNNIKFAEQEHTRNTSTNSTTHITNTAKELAMDAASTQERSLESNFSADDQSVTSLPSQTSVVEPLRTNASSTLAEVTLPSSHHHTKSDQSASSHAMSDSLGRSPLGLVTSEEDSSPSGELRTPSEHQERLSIPVAEHVSGSISAGCVVAIVSGVLITMVLIGGAIAYFLYRRLEGFRPKILSPDRSCANSDSGGYLDDQCRVAYVNSQIDLPKSTPEDLVSLDNDSFLNSLESMTIQNLWTDSIRHTKL